jgi:hypothetical protein
MRSDSSQALQQKVVQDFREVWLPRIKAKQCKVREAVAEIAKACKKSVWTIRGYLRKGRLTRGRRGLQRRRPATRLGRRPNLLARLADIHARAAKLKAKLAVLEKQRKTVVSSPDFRALLGQ